VRRVGPPVDTRGVGECAGFRAGRRPSRALARASRPTARASGTVPHWRRERARRERHPSGGPARTRSFPFPRRASATIVGDTRRSVREHAHQCPSDAVGILPDRVPALLTDQVLNDGLRVGVRPANVDRHVDRDTLFVAILNRVAGSTSSRAATTSSRSPSIPSPMTTHEAVRSAVRCVGSISIGSRYLSLSGRDSTTCRHPLWAP